MAVSGHSLNAGPSTASSLFFAFSRLCFGVRDIGSFLHTSELVSASTSKWAHLVSRSIMSTSAGIETRLLSSVGMPMI